MPLDHQPLIAALSTDCHSALSNTPLTDVRTRLMTAYHSTHLTALNEKDWWLIGTDGCHLCELAAADIALVAKRLKLPNVVQLELLNFDNAVVQILGTHIPVLITTHSLLSYPFGVMDIIHAAQHGE